MREREGLKKKKRNVNTEAGMKSLHFDFNQSLQEIQNKNNNINNNYNIKDKDKHRKQFERERDEIIFTDKYIYCVPMHTYTNGLHTVREVHKSKTFHTTSHVNKDSRPFC